MSFGQDNEPMEGGFAGYRKPTYPGTPPFNPEWEDRGFFSRNIQQMPVALGTGAATFGIAKWMLDPRKPNPVSAANNAALNRELYNLKPRGTVINNMHNVKWWEQAIMPPLGNNFDPNTNTVNVATKFGNKPGNYNPGILAHELGHAKQFNKPGRGMKLLNMMQGPTRALQMTGLTSLPQMFIDDEKTAGQAAGIGTALGAPVLAHEIDASRRGRNLLKKAAKKSGTKLSFIKSLAPYKGVPTYLLAAMMPYLSYKYLKNSGAYKKENQVKVNKKWGR